MSKKVKGYENVDLLDKWGKPDVFATPGGFWRIDCGDRIYVGKGLRWTWMEIGNRKQHPVRWSSKVAELNALVSMRVGEHTFDRLKKAA